MLCYSHKYRDEIKRVMCYVNPRILFIPHSKPSAISLMSYDNPQSKPHKFKQIAPHPNKKLTKIPKKIWQSQKNSLPLHRKTKTMVP
ncbi:MAG: hypothetical protein K2K88_00045 [Muribaculaceae bacterium]|nr:hypothetical protein [Muribaculaceae bacterium]